MSNDTPDTANPPVADKPGKNGPKNGPMRTPPSPAPLRCRKTSLPS